MRSSGGLIGPCCCLAGKVPPQESYQTLANLGQSISERYGASILSHLVLQALVPPPSLSWAGSILMDSEGDAHGKYGVTAPCLYLIRPDWYGGFRGSLGSLEHLQAYLKSIFVSP